MSEIGDKRTLVRSAIDANDPAADMRTSELVQRTLPQCPPFRWARFSVLMA
jgi:hypothetical protein